MDDIDDIISYVFMGISLSSPLLALSCCPCA
jgi:hypothetical protein